MLTLLRRATIHVTAIRVDPIDSDDLRDVTKVLWKGSRTTAINESARQAVVDFINGDGAAYAQGRDGLCEITVVTGRAPYLRVGPGDTMTDRLMSLPRF